MDARVEKISKAVKSIDSRLYAIRTPQGMIQIYREGDRIEATVCTEEYALSRRNPQFILAVTHDWKLTGKPVEWGVEPILARLKEMDSWNRERLFDDMVKNRENAQKDKERQRKNEIRSIAHDVRKDFAKLTDNVTV